MAIQTTYAENMRPGLPGQLADMVNKTLISRDVENAGGIRFGFPAAQGVADRGVIECIAGVTKILGVCVRDRSALGRKADGTALEGFALYESARILTIGTIWVTASVDVVAGDIVHVIVATAAWAKTGGVLVPNARWETTALATNIAKIRIGGPAS